MCRYDLLQLFQSSHCHMAILTDCTAVEPKPGPAGRQATGEADSISVVVDSRSHLRTSEVGSPCKVHAAAYAMLKAVRAPSSKCKSGLRVLGLSDFRVLEALSPDSPAGPCPPHARSVTGGSGE